MSSISNKKILILGAGSSGLAAAELAIAKGAQVYLVDENDSATLRNNAQYLIEQGAKCYFGWQKSTWENEFDLLVCSPGISEDSILGALMAKTTQPVLGELAFAATFCKIPIFAITGSNGKTTTVEIMTQCLNYAGKKAIAAGNIGLPLSKAVLIQDEYDIIIAEVSSFQLEHSNSLEVEAAALLNISQDHLDRHKTMQNYLREKMKLVIQSKEDAPIIIKKEILEKQNIAELLKERKLITFSAENNSTADYIIVGDYIGKKIEGKFIPLLDIKQLTFKGKHNYENIMCVFALSENLKLSNEKIADAVSNFQVPEHRLQKVAEVNGVTYINDSKATNLDAMIKAIKCCAEGKKRKIILIAGGEAKGCSFKEAKSTLMMYVKLVLAIGKNRQELASLWSEAVKIKTCETFAQACENAEAAANPGDTVLLSPACASFDMFDDYKQRGQIFIDFVNKLKRSNPK